MGGDKYRASLHLEGPTVEWRMGKPPNYEAVNKLFEEGRTKVGCFLLFTRSNIICVASFVVFFIGVAKRICGRTSAEYCQIIANGVCLQDYTTRFQEHKPSQFHSFYQW